MTDEGATAQLMDDHFIVKLAVELTMNDGWVAGVAAVRPELFAPGTARIRTGLLATMVDLVAGHTPSGPTGPTVDLRVELFGPAPSEGHVHLECRPLRVGSRLIVGETLLRSALGAEPFGRSLTTFMNMSLGPGLPMGPRPMPPMDVPSFDEFIGARRQHDGVFGLTPRPQIANGLQGTIQGGVQALLAELAAEDAVAVALGATPGAAAARGTATDLDFRYLSRIRVGPLVATASVHALTQGAGGWQGRTSVRLTDGGDGHRLVGFVALTLGSAPVVG